MAEFVPTLLNGLVLGAVYVLVAVGLSLIFSVMGVVNFAHGGFLMLGAFVTWTLVTRHGMSYVVALVLSTALVGLLGAATERLVFQPLGANPLHMLVASLGLAILFEDAAMIGWGAEDQAFPFASLGTVRIGEVRFPVERLGLVVPAAVIIGGLWLFLKRTRLGQALRAIAQDRDAAVLQGMNPGAVNMLGFGMGTAMAGAAGSLIAPIFMVSPFMGEVPMMKAFVVVVVGGLGSLPGSVLGGLIVGVIESFGATYLGAVFQNAVSFLLLMVVVIVRPSGLLGFRE